MANLSRCKNCDGEKLFDPAKGMLVCERCGSTYAVKETGDDPVRREYAPSYIPEENKNILNKYECSSCGAKIVVGTNNEVKRCSSCGNTTLVKIKGSTVAPDGIIPFKISRNQACEIFSKWVGSRKFAPSDLKQMAKLQKISGLYSPVWNMHYVETTKYSATAGKFINTSNGQQETREYEIDKIDEKKISNELHTANSRISDGFIEGLGEYDFSKTRPYSTDYLLGFAGIDTDIDVHRVYDEILEEASQDNKRKIESRLSDNYDFYDNLSCVTRLRNVYFNYTYVPIWANHYTYKGKKYHCYINGQTGKATGKAPKSILKVGGLILGVLSAIAVGVILLFKII